MPRFLPMSENHDKVFEVRAVGESLDSLFLCSALRMGCLTIRQILSEIFWGINVYATYSSSSGDRFGYSLNSDDCGCEVELVEWDSHCKDDSQQ